MNDRTNAFSLMRWLKPAAASRSELWVSILLAIFWTCLADHSVRPSDPWLRIISCLVSVVASILAFNGFLDVRRMTAPERVVAIAWLPLITFFAISQMRDQLLFPMSADR